jgi:5-methylcytosine-specific restriction endonuclease McrA
MSYDDYTIAPAVLPRVHISRKRAIALFDRDCGICWLCKLPIRVPKEQWHVAHDIARGLGGSNEDRNLHPAHDRCNLQEGREIVVPAVAKSDRVRARHLGIKKRKRGWGNKRFKGLVGGGALDLETGKIIGRREE